MRLNALNCLLNSFKWWVKKLREVSAKSVDNIACLLLHEIFEQTRDGKFLRFIIIIAPPHRVCVYLHEESYYSRVFSSGKRKYFFSPLIFFPPISFLLLIISYPLAISELSRVNVAWKMWTLCHFVYYIISRYFSMNFKKTYTEISFSLSIPCMSKKKYKNNIIETTSDGSWNIVYYGINFAAATK